MNFCVWCVFKKRDSAFILEAVKDMNSRKIGGGLLAGLAAVAAVGLGGAAKADTTFTFNSDLSGSEVVNLVGIGGVYAGRYEAQLGPAVGQGPLTNIFCVDFTHDIYLNSTYLANTQQMITNPAGPAAGGYYTGGLASALVPGDYNPSNLGTVSAAQRADEVALPGRQLSERLGHDVHQRRAGDVHEGHGGERGPDQQPGRSQPLHLGHHAGRRQRPRHRQCPA